MFECARWLIGPAASRPRRSSSPTQSAPGLGAPAPSAAHGLRGGLDRDAVLAIARRHIDAHPDERRRRGEVDDVRRPADRGGERQRRGSGSGGR